MIGSPERVKIPRSSIPKIRKIHSCVWKLYVKNSQNSQAKFWPSQNFPGIYTMIFSKETTRVVSIPKVMKIYSGVWKIQARKAQSCNLANLAISEFSWYIEYDFLKEHHKTCFHTKVYENKTQYDWFPGKSRNSKKFHTKNQEYSQLRLEVIRQKLSKQSIFAKKWPNFRLKWPKFRKIRIFKAYRSMISSKKTTRTTSIP